MLLALPKLPEKGGEECGAFLFQYSAGNFYLMIELLHLKKIQH